MDHQVMDELHTALRTNTGNFIKIIESGIDVNAQSLVECGDTVLICVCRYGNLSLVKYLFDNFPVKVDKSNTYGCTPLMVASAYGVENIVQYLVEKCHADVNKKDSHGWTALMSACQRGHENIVKYLIQKCNVDVNKQDNFGFTALMNTLWFGHTNIVKFLVTEGKSDVTIQDEAGNTALILASRFGYANMLKYLISDKIMNKQNNRGETALINSCYNCDFYFMKTLIQYGVDVNKKDNDGWTALMHASYEGYEYIVRYLKDADPYIQDEHGWTAVTCAVMRNRKSIVRYFIKECKSDVKKLDIESSQSKYISCTLLNACKKDKVSNKMKKYILECQHKQFIFTVYVDRLHFFDKALLKYIYPFLYPTFDSFQHQCVIHNNDSICFQ